MTTERTGRLPIHLGVYWHGVAEPVPGGVRMRSAFGPYVETLAESVDRVTLVAHDPPEDAVHGEQVADYLAATDNVDVLSLGPLGSLRDYHERMRRAERLVGPASERWDALLLRFGRRANLVFRANRCPRVVTLVWGTTTAGGLRPLLRSMRPIRIARGLRREWHLRRVLRSSGLAFTDGEACLEQYEKFVTDGHFGLLRSSVRRARYTHQTLDRLDRPDARFLVAGHVTIAKGALVAIDAFVRIRRELLPEATLHVAGIGPALDVARQRVREVGIEDAVTFHGWVAAGDELFGLYKDADVLLFLSTSSSESLPRVVSEAWAHSTLVVSTPVGSLPRAYRHRQELLFVPPGRPDAAFVAVSELLEQPELRRALIEAGARRAEEATLEYVTQGLLEAMVDRWPELNAVIRARSERDG